MLVKIGGKQVDVVDHRCAKRDCFALGEDKGSYTPGVGYTSYHKDRKGRRVSRWVCGTRARSGCPTHSVCPLCRLASIEPPGARCGGHLHGGRERCDGITVARSGDA